MRRRLPEIKESVEELKDRLRTEKRARIKQRIQALYLPKTQSAHSILDIAQILAIHRTTIGRWLRCYELCGLEATLEIRTKPNRQPSIEPLTLEVLKERLKEPEGFRSYKEIYLWLKEERGLEVAYRTVHQTVRYRLGAKPKVARREHIKKAKKNRKNLRMALGES